MSEGQVRLPFRLADILSGAKLIVLIAMVVVALVAWTTSQQFRIDYLEQRERDHPTKQELSETAIRIDNRISELERNNINLSRRIDDLDAHGTRALGERIAPLAQTQDNESKHIQDVAGRLNEIAPLVRKIDVVASRQEEVFRRLEATDRDRATYAQLETQTELMNAEIKRIEEQQSRIIQALDNTYNILQEALRGDKIQRQPTPGIERHDNGRH